jgi:hypothetical protein
MCTNSSCADEFVLGVCADSCLRQLLLLLRLLRRKIRIESILLSDGCGGVEKEEHRCSIYREKSERFAVKVAYVVYDHFDDDDVSILCPGGEELIFL